VVRTALHVLRRESVRERPYGGCEGDSDERAAPEGEHHGARHDPADTPSGPRSRTAPRRDVLSGHQAPAAAAAAPSPRHGGGAG